MRFIARFAMRGPFFAAAAAAALVLASLSVGLLLILSGAVVALTTLRHGAREGLRVMAIAASLAFVVRFLIAGQGVPIVIVCLLAWIPAWLMALLLDRHRQQAVPLMFAAALVALYALLMRALVGDVSAFWLARLEPMFEMIARDTGTRFGPEQVAFIARNLHTWTLVAVNCMLAGTILLGRWWQSVLFNPGGFGSEFREFRLPREVTIAAALAAAAFAIEQLGGPGVAAVGDVFVILVVLFSFQGLAVIHFRARVVSLASGWLGGMYVLLMLMPQIVGPLLATAGVADGLADFRGLRRMPDGDS